MIVEQLSSEPTTHDGALKDFRASLLLKSGRRVLILGGAVPDLEARNLEGQGFEVHVSCLDDRILASITSAVIDETKLSGDPAAFTSVDYSALTDRVIVITNYVGPKRLRDLLVEHRVEVGEDRIDLRFDPGLRATQS